MRETQKNWVTHPNGQNPRFNHHLQLKTKRILGVVVEGFQRGKRQFIWRQKRKLFGKQMFIGPCKNNERVDSGLSSTTTSPYSL